MRTHCANGHELTLENTYTHRGHIQCKECRRLHRNASYRRAARARFYENHTEDQLERLYGITGGVPERDAILASQNNACPICERAGLIWGKGYNDVWHIDYAHDQPGTHRGILCATCNTALGRLEPFLIRVVWYMMKWSPAFSAQIKELQ